MRALTALPSSEGQKIGEVTEKIIQIYRLTAYERASQFAPVAEVSVHLDHTGID